MVSLLANSLQNKKLVVDGKEYELNQHGFARDTDFDMKKQKNGKEITFVLESNAATEDLYPYRFRLEIIYTLDLPTDLYSPTHLYTHAPLSKENEDIQRTLAKEAVPLVFDIVSNYPSTSLSASSSTNRQLL